MSRSFAPRGPSIQDNDGQAFATQRELPILGAVSQPEHAPEHLIARCQDRLDAIRLAVQMSRLSNDEICRRLGLDPGHFTRMMQGRANFPDRKSVELMRVTGSLAPLQFEARAMGFELVERSKDERIRELEQQLEAIKRAA